MDCDHCNILRRAEGGIRIGGRIALATVPACPCSELRRVDDDDSVYWSYNNVLNQQTIYEFNLDAGWRMCTSDEREIVPDIMEVVGVNFDIGIISTTNVFIIAMQPIPQNCAYLSGDDIVGFDQVVNGVHNTQSYYPSVIPGRATIFRFGIYLSQFTLPLLPSAPVVNVKYRFRRIG